jgi:hypothetical protein
MELRINIVAASLTTTLLLVSGLFTVGCSSEPDLERTSIKSRTGSGDGEGQTDSGSKKKKKGKKSGKDKSEDLEDQVDRVTTDTADDDETDKGGDDEENPQPEVIEYPQFDFKGSGYTTYELKDRLAMRMDIRTEMDESILSLNTTTAKVECGRKDGCDQRDVDKKVNASSLGANVYTRISAGEIRDMKKNGENVPSYAIFAKAARSKQGVNFSFAAPIPVYPWPGKISRYEDLDRGPRSWTTSVTADVYIPNHPDVDMKQARDNGPNLEKNGRAIKTFDVTVTFSKVSTAGGEVKIKMEIYIPKDYKRMLYEYFPMPRVTEYAIDTDAQNIMQALMTSWSNGDRSKDPEESVLTYKICTRKTSRETKEFSCQ